MRPFQVLSAGFAHNFSHAIYLFTRSVVLLGAGRAAVFPTLVPPCVLLIGWLVLGSQPSGLQLIGLAIVLIGFRLVVKT